MRDLTKESITVNMVVRTTTDKYRVSPDETSLSNIQELIASGNFTAEYIPASFSPESSTGTLIVTEKN